MKTLKSFMLLVGILLGSTVFYSCLDDDDAYSEFWRDSVQAIVTVKPLVIILTICSSTSVRRCSRQTHMCLRI